MWRCKLSTSTVSLDRWKSRSTYSWPCWQPGVYSAGSSWFSCPSTTTARRRRPQRGAGSRTWRTGECNEGWSGDFLIQVNIIELTCWNLRKQKLGSIAVGIGERRRWWLLLMMIPKTTRTQWHFQVNWQGAATSADADDAGPRHTRYYTLTQLISTSRTKEFKNTTNNGNPWKSWVEIIRNVLSRGVH